MKLNLISYYLKSQKPSCSRGNSEIPIIIIVVLGAFFLAGGQYIFQGQVSSDKTAKTPTIEDKVGDEWKITIGNKTCDAAAHKASVDISLFGPKTAKYAISIMKNGAYTPLLPGDYKTPPNQTDTRSLTNADGFDVNPWRVELVADNTFVATAAGEPTACP